MDWEQARQTAYRAGTALPHQTVPLAEALGQTLAEPVLALQDIPHYASSAMDGWAVSGEPPWALAGADSGEPADLPWLRPAPHAASGAVPLAPGHAVPVLTGGVLPLGTTAVLRSECGLVRDGILEPGDRARADEPRPGEHIRPAGEEASAGEEAIPAGVRLNPAQIALAAVCGHDTLPVLRCPRVSLLLTGDEVIEAGLPQPGQVRDTFGPQLPSFVTMLGGHMDVVSRVHDELDDVVGSISSEALDEMSLARASSDVLITTGGTGTSSADHIRQALLALEARILIDGIAMRPGHPTLLAQLPSGRFLVGLPGNPLAAMMAMLTVAWPLLAGLRGAAFPAAAQVLAGADLGPLPGRTRLLPYRTTDGRAVPQGHHRPGMLRGLAAADGVLVIPPAGCRLDQPLQAVPLPWTGQRQ
jgi:molybdopterin molybdotransferase